MDKDAIEGLYENLRVICYQLPSFLNDFENGFKTKNESDKLIKESIKELLKTLQDDAFTSADLINEILNAEDDDLLRKGVA